MYSLIKKQKGLTPVSTIAVVVVVAFFILIMIKILPVYKDQWVIQSILAGLEKDGSMAAKSRTELRDIIMRRAGINQISRFTEKDIIIEKQGGATVVSIQVDVLQPVVGNLSLHVAINEQVQLR